MIDGDPAIAKLLIVAMSPGEEELDQGIPLVGPTGRMIWKILSDNGVTRPQCYIVNVIGELPEGDGGKKITDEQLDKYWDAFDDAVSKYNGEVVLLLGRDALRRFAGFTEGIETWRGYMVDPSDCKNLIYRTRHEVGVYKSGKKKGQPKQVKVKAAVSAGATLCPNLTLIIPTLHPAGVMRTGNATLPALVEDVGRACRGINNWADMWDRANSVYNNSPSIIGFTPSTDVAFDVEGVDFITDIGIAGRYTYGDSRKWDASSKAFAQKVLGDPNTVKVAHNAPYDLELLTQEEVEVNGPIADTMLMAAMLQPDMPKGLKYVASMYLDIKRWDHLYNVDMAKYNALDAKHTIDLYVELKRRLRNAGQMKLLEETIMPCIPTLMEMTRVGLRVSISRRIDWTDRLQAELEALDANWRTLHPDCPEWSKPLRIKKYFKERFGLEVQYNKYGKETVDENALRTLMHEYPEHKEMLEHLLKLRKTSKELKTYASVPISSEHTVHPSYLPAGKDDDRYDETGEATGKGLAGTWRPTAKNPNIQNQPKEARKMFVPRVPGHVFVEMDYASFEARILAALSGDRVLEEAIESDLHKHNEEALGVDRTRAKNGFYGWSYGAGARTLKNTFRTKGYDISERQCKELLYGFDKLYAKAARYRNSVISTAKISRVVTNPFGLRRYFYGNNVGTAPANTIIQSTAAIIMWKVLPLLSKEAKRQGGVMVAMVHDSVEFELPAGFDPQPFRDIMEQEFPEVAPGFRVPIDIKVGPSWGEVEKIAA